MFLKYVGKQESVNVRVSGQKRKNVKAGEVFECEPDCAAELLNNFNIKETKQRPGMVRFVEVNSGYQQHKAQEAEENKQTEEDSIPEKKGPGRPPKVKMSEPEKTV